MSQRQKPSSPKKDKVMKEISPDILKDLFIFIRDSRPSKKDFISYMNEFYGNAMEGTQLKDLPMSIRNTIITKLDNVQNVKSAYKAGITTTKDFTMFIVNNPQYLDTIIANDNDMVLKKTISKGLDIDKTKIIWGWEEEPISVKDFILREVYNNIKCFKVIVEMGYTINENDFYKLLDESLQMFNDNYSEQTMLILLRETNPRKKEIIKFLSKYDMLSTMLNQLYYPEIPLNYIYMLLDHGINIGSKANVKNFTEESIPLTKDAKELLLQFANKERKPSYSYYSSEKSEYDNVYMFKKQTSYGYQGDSDYSDHGLLDESYGGGKRKNNKNTRKK